MILAPRFSSEESDSLLEELSLLDEEVLELSSGSPPAAALASFFSSFLTSFLSSLSAALTPCFAIFSVSLF